MKYSSGGIFCVCLLTISTVAGWAQNAPAQAPAQQPAAQPAQNPPAQNQPEQQGPITKQPPPLPPRLPDVQMPDEGRISVGFFGWFPMGHPNLEAGQNSSYYGIPAYSDLSYAQLRGTPKFSPGYEATIPAGKFNDFRISFYEVRASGDFTAPNNLLLWFGNYSKGDYLTTDYRYRNLKLSYDFLTWPHPVGTRRFRLKTLYQFQYINMDSGFNAPLKASSGTQTAASGHESVYLPTLGIGIAYYITPHFRFEANGTGFAIPSHSNILDTDATLAYRISRVEIRAGAKFLHFQTSLQNSYFMIVNQGGLEVGLRFFLN